MCDSAESELSSRLRGAGAPLGEVFSFISALYFRGKLAYARRFANAPPTIDGAFVITACGGLITPGTMVTRERLREISANNIDLMNHPRPETIRLLLQSRRLPLPQPIGTTLLAPIQEGRFGKGLASLYFLRGWNGEAAEGSYKLLCTEKLSFFVGNVYHFRYNDAALAS